MEVLVQDERLHDGAHQQGDGVHVAVPHVLLLVLHKLDQQSATKRSSQLNIFLKGAKAIVVMPSTFVNKTPYLCYTVISLCRNTFHLCHKALFVIMALVLP